MCCYILTCIRSGLAEPPRAESTRLVGLSPFSFPAALPLPPLDFSGKRVVVVEWCEGESFIMVPPEEEECRSVD